MNFRTVTVVVAAAVLLNTAAFAQPTTGEQDVASKVDCSDFKSSPEGTWTGKGGKTYKKDDHMAIALQQKCSGGKKQ